MLENLQPAPKIETPIGWKPAVEFDGIEGVATTPGLADGLDYTEFLEQAGYSPDIYEVIGAPRTSRWQVYDGSWRTSYRFHFRLKPDNAVALPLLYKEAKKTKAKEPKPVDNGKVLVIATADYQIGKVASRGGTPDLLARIFMSYAKIASHLKKNKYEQIIILDAGDIIENFGNAADLAQLQSNDLSLMDQVDLAATLQWDLIKLASKHSKVTYASVGSNHCQWRVSKQVVGKPVDDWGIFIVKQLRKLATEVGLDVKFLIPADVRDAYSAESVDSTYANRMFDLWLAKYKAKTITNERERIIKELEANEHIWRERVVLVALKALINGETNAGNN